LEIQVKSIEEIIMEANSNFLQMAHLINKWGEENWFKVDPINDFIDRGLYIDVESYIESLVKSYGKNEDYVEKLNNHISKYEGKYIAILHRPGDFQGLLIPEYINKDIKPGSVTPMWSSGVPEAAYKAFDMLKGIISSAKIVNVSIQSIDEFPFYCIIFVFEKEIDMIQLEKMKLMMV
jgi:hypothetical protein